MRPAESGRPVRARRQAGIRTGDRARLFIVRERHGVERGGETPPCKPRPLGAAARCRAPRIPTARAWRLLSGGTQRRDWSLRRRRASRARSDVNRYVQRKRRCPVFRRRRNAKIAQILLDQPQPPPLREIRQQCRKPDVAMIKRVNLAMKQKLYLHKPCVALAARKRIGRHDPHIQTLMRRMRGLRQQHSAIGGGGLIEFECDDVSNPTNAKRKKRYSRC